MRRIGPAEIAARWSHPSRWSPRQWLFRAALLAGVGLLGVALVGQWNSVRSSIDELTLSGLATSGMVTVLAVGTTGLSWRALLAGFGTRLPLRAAVRIFFVGQVGKYIPGSVWPVLAQMELSRGYGVPRERAASASLTLLALAVPCGAVAAAVTLSFVSAGPLRHYWWALVAVPLFVVVLIPAVLSRLLAFVFRLLRRPPLNQQLAGRSVLTASVWLLAAFVLHGVATWLLARDLQPSMNDSRLLLLSVGSYALAWTAGFLVLVVPAGAGVREAVLILTLSPALASGPATLLALVLRVFATAADLVWTLIGSCPLSSFVRRKRPC